MMLNNMYTVRIPLLIIRRITYLIQLVHFILFMKKYRIHIKFNN